MNLPEQIWYEFEDSVVSFLKVKFKESEKVLFCCCLSILTFLLFSLISKRFESDFNEKLFGFCKIFSIKKLLFRWLSMKISQTFAILGITTIEVLKEYLFVEWIMDLNVLTVDYWVAFTRIFGFLKKLSQQLLLCRSGTQYH